MNLPTLKALEDTKSTAAVTVLNMNTSKVHVSFLAQETTKLNDRTDPTDCSVLSSYASTLVKGHTVPW